MPNAKFTPQGEGGGAFMGYEAFIREWASMRVIYGKHVSPGKQVNCKNDAIMQIEANLINNV